ncbi:FadR/GntR family transcriptional regulator [Caballeronia sp. LZ002]|nr:FadR/GntR family transcriptional regulator [Caballeronia sp. LZ002]
MPAFESVKTKRVSDIIGEQIRRKLGTGELKPGDKLPAERDLALEMGVGRNAVREALRSLEMSGVVTLQKGPKGGSFVSNGSVRSLSQGLKDLLALRGITIGQLTRARVLIEMAVAQAACESADEDDLAALDAQLELAEAAYKRREYGAKLGYLVDFHNILANATHNPVLVFVMASIMELMHDYATTVGPDRNDLSVKALRRLTQSLRERDIEASRTAIREHLERLEERYLRYQALGGTKTKATRQK